MGISLFVGVRKLRASSRRVAVWAVVLGAASTFAPAALAETPPAPAVPALPDATVIVAAALTAAEPVVTPMPELALPAPASAVSPVVTPVPPVPVPVPPTDPATAAPTQTAAAAPVEAAPKTPVAAPREAPETSEAPEAPKARVIAPDAPDPLPAPVQALVEPVEQAVEQVQPVNINISVRVDSPGDNGAVTQINEAVFAPLPGDAPAETQYQEPDQQYQDAGTAGETSVAPAAPDNPAPAAETTAAPDDSWNWTWTWSCGDVMPPEIVLPEEYLQQIWNWNWTWNCGGNTSTNGNSETQLPPQYQPVTSQYQPINVNVSIRIASPGNDGPVVQTNLAVAMPTVQWFKWFRWRPTICLHFLCRHYPPRPGRWARRWAPWKSRAAILGQAPSSPLTRRAHRGWRSRARRQSGTARPRFTRSSSPRRSGHHATPPGASREALRHRSRPRRLRRWRPRPPRSKRVDARECKSSVRGRRHARSCRIASPPARSATRASARWARPGRTARRSSSSSSLPRSSSLSPMPLGVSPRSGKPRPRTPAIGAKNRASAPLLQFLSSGRLPARKCFGRRRD